MRFDTTRLSVGQKIHYGTPGSWDVQLGTGTVERITPSGQVVVRTGPSHTRRFDARGEEIGSSSRWRRAFLMDETAYQGRVADKQRAQRERALTDALRALGVANDPKEAILARLDALRAEVEALR